jgi:hypothetical protein
MERSVAWRDWLLPVATGFSFTGSLAHSVPHCPLSFGLLLQLFQCFILTPILILYDIVCISFASRLLFHLLGLLLYLGASILARQPDQ